MLCPVCGSSAEATEYYCGECGACLSNADTARKASDVDNDEPRKKRYVAVAVALASLAVIIAGALLFPRVESDSVTVTAQSQSALQQNSSGDVSENIAGFEGVESAFASSTLSTGGINSKSYNADNVLDGDTSTTWAEGAPGSGAGEFIVLSGKGQQVFSGLIIYAGYQESDYLYSINARPKKIAIYGDDDLVCTVVLVDANQNYQRINFENSIVAESITLEILSVYEGSKYEDCCISEVVPF